MSFSFKIFFLKISLKILLIFLHLFYQSGLIFGCVLYRKDINPVLKYPICVKTYEKYIFKKCFVLKHGLVSPIYIYINIMTSYFHTTKEDFKNNICISMHFGFNNQFIQAMRTRPIFQKF